MQTPCVLCATDLSFNADAALPYAFRLAALDKLQVHLLHVFEPPFALADAWPGASGTGGWGDYTFKWRAKTESTLAHLAAKLVEQSGVAVVSGLREGDPVRQILDHIERFEPKYVVMATHGRTGFSQLLLGSVAEAVVRRSPSPVLTVRPRELVVQPPGEEDRDFLGRRLSLVAPDRIGRVQLKNIALTTDFSENAAAAVPLAVEWTRRFEATLHLVHVFDPSPFFAGVVPDSYGVFNPTLCAADALRVREQWTRERALHLAALHGIRVEPCLRQGPAVQGILAAAKEQEADAILIATEGRTGLSHFLLGSVAERVVRLSPCPVLTVRAWRKTDAAPQG